ncbi:MAG: UDP-glucose 4-epimerase GalE [Sedimentisphaerales bacterium]|nr:UDP-glucose 4-epimerase GalE [Sedimentisphaerales bacterium]
MRVLVCGGAGYIGSNMTAMLAAKGHEPVVFDNLSKGHKSAIGKTELVEGDLADSQLLVETLEKKSIEAVMHFAAFIEVGESVQAPLKYYRNNLCCTENLLSAMETVGVEKFVFSSTAAVYGTPKKVPITEDSPTDPINPYGQTKLAVERMCHYQSQTGKLAYVSLRYFNTCGAGNNATLGEDHRPESHLIPLTIQAAMGKRGDIKIYGTDYDTPDGTCIRDYIHIDDLCRAHLLALDWLDQGRELICNLGNEKGHSVREVIETVKKISGKDFKVTEVDRRPGDSPKLTADATKARKELGWKIEKPDIKEMVSTAWQWHNKNPNGYPD